MTNGYGKNLNMMGFTRYASVRRISWSHYSYKPTTLGNRRILSANEDGIQGTVSLSFPRRPYTRPFPDMFFISDLVSAAWEKAGKLLYAPWADSYITGYELLQLPIDDYVPAYTRTEITDAIQNAFGFRTDYEVLSEKQMKKILRTTKKI